MTGRPLVLIEARHEHELYGHKPASKEAHSEEGTHSTNVVPSADIDGFPGTLHTESGPATLHGSARSCNRLHVFASALFLLSFFPHLHSRVSSPGAVYAGDAEAEAKLAQ